MGKPLFILFVIGFCLGATVGVATMWQKGHGFELWSQPLVIQDKAVYNGSDPFLEPTWCGSFVALGCLLLRVLLFTETLLLIYMTLENKPFSTYQNSQPVIYCWFLGFCICSVIFLLSERPVINY